MFDFLLGNDPLSGIIAFFVVLIPLILIHELGHFLAAKAAGITVLEFGIGFPPRIVRLFTWRETEFTLNWIPLGGFVRPLGDDLVRPLDDESVEKDREIATSRLDDLTETNTHKTRSVNEARPLSRIFFMAAGALANFLLAFVLFTAVALIGLPERIGGSIAIIGLQSGSQAAESGLQPGDVILRLNDRLVDDTEAFFADLYSAEGQVTLTVQRNGIEQEVLFTGGFGDRSVPAIYAQIARVEPDTPAQRAGIVAGDIITAFNGQPLTSLDNLREKTSENAGSEITLTLLHQNEIKEVSLVPRQNPPQGQGAMGISTWLTLADTNTGILYRTGPSQQKRTPQPLQQAFAYAFDRIGFVIGTTLSIPSQLISGALSPDEARPVSIVGVSQIGGIALQQSIEEGSPQVILDFIAMISVALGFFNLLPLPALDGGRILFVLIEIVRGHPIAPEREGMVHLIGLALLLSLSVLVVLNDFINPITDLIR